MMKSALDYDRPLLTKLIALKAVTLLVAILLVIGIKLYFTIDLPYIALVITLAISGVILLAWCLRMMFSFPVTEREVFLLLMSDIVILLCLIEQSGGGANPFTSSMLVPLALSAALLRKRYSLVVVVFSVGAYAYWTFAGDGGMHHHMDHSEFSLHLYGMWINFLLSAFILFIFVTYAMGSVRNRDAQLQDAREKMLRDEQLVAIATVTATTAHALGTPLSTMSILLEQWQQENALDDDEVQLFQEQLAVCKNHLASIGSATRGVASTVPEYMDVTVFYTSLRDHFQILRPVDDLVFSIDDSLEGFQLKQNQFLLLALANLVDNALQSGGEHTTVAFTCEKTDLAIAITDDGKGLSEEVRDKLGKRFISSNKNGWGLGVYLSNSTVERFDGEISMLDGPSGGTITTVKIPLKAAVTS